MDSGTSSGLETGAVKVEGKIEAALRTYELALEIRQFVLKNILNDIQIDSEILMREDVA